MNKKKNKTKQIHVNLFAIRYCVYRFIFSDNMWVGGLIELRDGNNNHMACLDNILDRKCLTTTTQEGRRRAHEI
jgi:hypothetical protein